MCKTFHLRCQGREFAFHMDLSSTTTDCTVIIIDHEPGVNGLGINVEHCPRPMEAKSRRRRDDAPMKRATQIPIKCPMIKVRAKTHRLPKREVLLFLRVLISRDLISCWHVFLKMTIQCGI